MSNNRQENSKNVNKITILNISGKRKDRDAIKDHLKKCYCAVDASKKDLSKCSSKQIIRKIQGYETQYKNNLPKILLFENLNSNIVQNIGDELENMIIDFHFNKVNKFVLVKQFGDLLDLLGKL